MFKVAAPCLATLLLLTSPASAQYATWEETHYNPVPLEDDFILPMPCGGAMAFRRVEVDSTGYLDDRRIRLGVRDDNIAYKEDPRFDFISGSFESQGNARHYYIAKYELTQLQHAALSGNCERPSTRLKVPQTELTWFEAVEASRLYSEWLLRESRQSLPVEEDVTSFVRLPTETEWEFAARGGLAVDEAGFTARMFPMDDGTLAEYVWYQGAQSAAGRLRPIGLLKPNPLGIHDVLGNASEITMDLFRLNRRGRLHGQAGGFVARGGDITTSQSQMRTALRTENQFFDTRSGAARTVPNMGVRFVLSVPVITSQSRLTRLRTEWENLPAAEQGGRESRNAQRDALAQIAQASEAAENEEVRQQLSSAITELERLRTEQNDARDRSIRALLQSGAIIANKVRTDHVLLAGTQLVTEQLESNIARSRELMQRAERAGETVTADRARTALAGFEADLASRRNRIDDLEQVTLTVSASYSDLVFNMTSDYPFELIAPQLEGLIIDYESQGFDYLIPFAQTFVSHIEDYRRTGELSRDAWTEDLINLGADND